MELNPWFVVICDILAELSSWECVRYHRHIRSCALKHLWGICHLQTAFCEDQMAWLDVQSGGRKEDPEFQASLVIQQNSVSKISKQLTRNSEKMRGGGRTWAACNGQQSCDSTSSAWDRAMAPWSHSSWDCLHKTCRGRGLSTFHPGGEMGA